MARGLIGWLAEGWHPGDCGGIDTHLLHRGHCCCEFCDANFSPSGQ
jgi:hypothetical protein